MILKIIFYLKILFLVSSSFAIEGLTKNNSNNNSIIDNLDITDFLNKTEDLRTKNHSEFSSNLKILSNQSNKFTPIQQCFYDYLVSYGLIYKGDFIKGEKKAIEVFNQCEDIEIKVRTKILLANYFVNMKKYYDAINNLNFAISNLDKIKSKKVKHFAYSVSFLVYEMFNQNELSLKFSELLINDTPSDNDLCLSKLNIFNITLKSNYSVEIDEEVDHAIKFCKNIGEHLYDNFLNIFWIHIFPLQVMFVS